MPTLRDAFRRALAAHDPDEVAARRDLDRVLARRRNVHTWVPALAAAAIFAGLYFATRPAPPPPRVTSLPHGVRVYVRASGEPESRALVLDLDTKGEL